MRKFVYAIAGAAVAAPLAILAPIPAATASPHTKNPAPVEVTNTNSNPVPVTGEVSAAEGGTWNVGITGTPNVDVNNLPSTQNVSGTVNIGNLPAVQQVSGALSSADQTTVLANTTLTGQGGNSAELINNANVSSAREVRLSIWCSGSPSCSNVGVDLWADGNYLVDQFAMTGSGYSTSFVSRVYDIPGTRLSVLVVNVNAAMTFTTELVGRSN